MEESDKSAIAVICQVLQDAGESLSRTEIRRAIENRHVLDLPRTLEIMLGEGILVSEQGKTDHSTVVLRYQLAEDFDADRWLSSID
jgi:hypothetical protein